jgi:hypothetical protein
MDSTRSEVFNGPRLPANIVGTGRDSGTAEATAGRTRVGRQAKRFECEALPDSSYSIESVGDLDSCREDISESDGQPPARRERTCHTERHAAALTG